MTPETRISPQAGIALGPILFIIALLAILAAAIAAGSGSFTSGTTQENAKLMASTIVQQAVTLDDAVNVVRGHGYTDTQISFAVQPNLFLTADGTDFGQSYPLATSLCNSAACTVFAQTGGGTKPVALPQAAIDQAMLDIISSGWVQCPAGNNLGCRAPQIWLMQFMIEGTNPPLHLAYFPYAPLTKEVCMAINTLVGVSNPSGDAPQDGAVGSSAGDAQGSWQGYDPIFYYQSYGFVYIFQSADTFTRSKDFCFGTGGAGYYYVHVFK